MNWIDLTVIIIVAYSIYRGYRDGLIMQLAALFGLLLGAIFAGKVAEYLEPQLAAIFQISTQYVGILSYIATFVLILIACSLLGKMAQRFAEAIHIGFLDKLGGIFFCTLKWLFLFSIFLNVFEKMDANEWVIKSETKKESRTHNAVKSLMRTAVPYFSTKISKATEKE